MFVNAGKASGPKEKRKKEKEQLAAKNGTGQCESKTEVFPPQRFEYEHLKYYPSKHAVKRQHFGG